MAFLFPLCTYAGTPPEALGRVLRTLNSPGPPRPFEPLTSYYACRETTCLGCNDRQDPARRDGLNSCRHRLTGSDKSQARPEINALARWCQLQPEALPKYSFRD